MKLRPVQPIGSQFALSLVHGAFLRVEEPVYPPSRGAELRAARQEAGVGLREAARLAGISAADWTRLEVGAAVPDSWTAVFRVVDMPDADEFDQEEEYDDAAECD